ncbi:hypothetical protein [Cohnella boryungensis]|uniref:Uncharacterized protein n=1 Tax=Cohnella boryungensis TaxID=768479 RepID=A0ABV8SG27_9BACL
MTKETGASSIFTKERIADAVQLWTRSSISLIDVRHQLIRPDKPLQNYIMPTSMLIYPAAGWPVSKWIAPSTDGALWSFSRGKGTELSIHPADTPLDTFMMLYKAETAPFYRREIHCLLERMNPFLQAYGAVQ